MGRILASKLNKNRFRVVELARIHLKGEMVNCDHKFLKQFGIMRLDWLY